jgi:hypothetical protein
MIRRVGPRRSPNRISMPREAHMSRGQRISLVTGVTGTLLVVLLSFSTGQSRFACEGAVTLAGDSDGFTSRPATLAATVQVRRWFAVWTNRESMITRQIEPGHHTGRGSYSPDPLRSRMVIFDKMKNQGSWSPMSKQISVKVFPDRLETFNGMCE